MRLGPAVPAGTRAHFCDEASAGFGRHSRPYDCYDALPQGKTTTDVLCGLLRSIAKPRAISYPVHG